MSARKASPIDGLSLSASHVGLTNEAARQRGMVQPLGQPIDHRGFKGVVMQNRRIDEGGELRLAPRRFFGLAAHPRPYRIDLCRVPASSDTAPCRCLPENGERYGRILA